MKKIFFLSLIFAISLLCSFSVLAFEMKSSQFRIQMGHLNIGSGKESLSANTNLAYTLGQNAAMEFAENGYIIKAGFQYLHSIVPFSFTVSETRIDFGELYPYDPKTASTNLTVSYGGGGNYQILAYEEAPLTTLDGNNQIPNTCCDPGCDDPGKCDQNTAALWVDSSTVGFGYNMSGEDIPSTFESPGCNGNCYRRFADQSVSPPEEPVAVMSSNNVTVDLSSKPKDIYHEATMTFKVNIDPNQAGGNYQTIIHFIALPSY